MADLYSRDELAEPLRQLGWVLARVMQQGFMPDSTKSGRFPTPHHKEEKQDNLYISAETYIEGLRRANEQLPDIAYPELEDQIEEVEQDPMDEEEADTDIEATTEVQERAAEVETDTAHAEPNTTKEPKPQTFVPKMPEFEFSVIRHLFQGSRHWCVKEKTRHGQTNHFQHGRQ